MEDFKEKYKQALGWMQSLYNGLHGKTKEEAEHFFPELAENKDERIRKELLDYLGERIVIERLTDTRVKEEWIAWLEKQGHEGKKWIYEDVYIKEKEQVFQDGIDEVLENPQKYGLEKQGEIQNKLKKYRNYLVNEAERWSEKQHDKINSKVGAQDCIGHANALISARAEFEEIFDYDSWNEKQGEENPTNKVEPKFKVDDWVVYEENIYQIYNISLKKYYECLRIDGTVHTFDFKYIDSKSHLWTIQDAKDGDILFAKGSYFKEYAFIYSGITEDNVLSTYCGFDIVRNNFDTKLTRFGRVEDFEIVCPATKEQRDLLFQKMKEAGYEWDAEKKEMKKIGQEPAWNEEDEQMLQKALSTIRYALLIPIDKEDDPCFAGSSTISWLKSLKEKIKGD